jgi:hypothetical protein
VQTWEVWKLRFFLLSGLLVLLVNAVNEQVLGMPIPNLLALYLASASFYFAVDPQKHFLQCREQKLLFCLFPGAFVTALLPLYTVLLFALERDW